MKNLEIIQCKPLRKSLFESLAVVGGISFAVGFFTGYLVTMAVWYSIK